MPKRGGGGNAYSKLCEGDDAPCRSRRREVGKVFLNTKSGKLEFKGKSTKNDNDFLIRAARTISEDMGGITEKLGRNKTEIVKNFRAGQKKELGKGGAALRAWRENPANQAAVQRALANAQEKLRTYRCFTPAAKEQWMIIKKRTGEAHKLNKLPPGSSEEMKMRRKQENKNELEAKWEQFKSNPNHFQTREQMQARREIRYSKQKQRGYYSKTEGKYVEPLDENDCRGSNDNLLYNRPRANPRGGRGRMSLR